MFFGILQDSAYTLILDSLNHPWGPMGAHGNPWGPMGTHGDPWGPIQREIKPPCAKPLASCCKILFLLWP